MTTPLVATIGPTGITAPTYADILASLHDSYRSIYGSDVYLEADSQDGQMIAIFALAIHDCNASVIAAYNQFSPVMSRGEGLSSVVKINGLRRLAASNSTATVRLVGQAGATINKGIVSDGKHQWALPDLVAIPITGQIDVLATCATIGAITAPAGTLTQIVTPARGWQTATNIAAATPGAPVETDAALRVRQAVSTSLPALSVLSSIISHVADLDGVTAWSAYENDTDTVDANGVLAHSISLVVDGGDPAAIARTIARHKTPGTGTYGTVSTVVADEAGPALTVKFFRPVIVPVVVEIDLDPLPGYVSGTGVAIARAVAAYITGLPIGSDVYLSKLFASAELSGLNGTYNVTAIRVARGIAAPAAADVAIAFMEVADCQLESVTLTASL